MAWRLFDADRSRRSFALAWLTVAVVPCFALTSAVTRAHHAELTRLAAEWSARGERALEHGAAADAIADFRNALSYDESNAVRLRLAQALVAADRQDEALGYLATLWDDTPGDGPVNLELARLYARRGNVPSATRYYHGAIEGAWAADAERRRRTARLELARLLVKSGDKAHAEPELVALASDLPPDPATRKDVADLLARTGLLEHARAVLETVIAATPRDTDALAAIGEIAFRQRDFAAASKYLARAAPANAAARADARIARLVLDANPYERRLARTDRARRAHAAFAAAEARLAQCGEASADDPALAPLRDRRNALQRDAREQHLRVEPDAIDAVMDFVFDVESATAGRCGEPADLDRALQMLGEVRRGSR